MAVLSSTTACAAITPVAAASSRGSVPNVSSIGEVTTQHQSVHHRSSSRLAEKLHGLTEKLASLGSGLHRTGGGNSDEGRTRTGR